MRFNNRAMALVGIPDLPDTAFQHNGNRKIKPQGGGGGGQTTSTSYQTNIPEYARPYVEQMLGATQRQLFTGTTNAQGQFTPTGFNNFTPYGSTYQTDAQGNPLRDSSGNVLYTNTAMDQARAAVAPMSVGQQQAINTINQYVAPSQTQGATSIAGNIAGRSAASGYYAPLQAERFQLGSPQQVRTDSFTAPGVSQAYMSPYMQNVVNAQQREARRAGEMQRMQNQAQAVGQGAFGGSRQAIVEAERQRNLATQLGDIQAQGLQQAYGQGMGQFNAEQQAYLAAQQANQGANLQAAIQNLQAQQQAQAAQEASRQFGANLGLQGYGQALQAAQTLGQLGQQQYQQDLGTIQAMSGLGAQEQAQTQNVINQALQNYATQQQYPLMQLGVMSNMLRGLPMQASTTQNYQAQPSLLSQGAGALGTSLGLVQQYNKAFPGSKEGGIIKMASGGIATGVPAGKLGAMLRQPNFSDDDLQKKASDPQTDQATKDLVAAEIARRANLRAGMATGGIVAFRKGSKKAVKESTEQKAEDISVPAANDVDSGSSGIRAALEKGSPTSAVPVSPEPEVTPLTPEERRVAIRQSYAGAQPREEAMVMPVNNADIVAAARKNVSPVPVAPAPNSQGIAAAPQGPSYRDTEAANLEAGLSASGQSPAAEKDDAEAKLEQYLGVLQGQLPELEKKKNLSTKEATAQYAKERKDAGIPDLFQVEKDKLEQRKLRGEESERETAKNNLIRFLTKWGTIPGNAMRGMIGAGADLIDKMDIDEKHRQKFLNELDDIDSRINKEEYARRIGDEERARKERTEAGKQYYDLAEKIADVRAKEALKDKDAQRAIKVELLKIDREKAKGPKGDEYMVGVYSKGLTASDPKKYPPGPLTDKIAAEMYQQNKAYGTVTAAGIAAGPAGENALTNALKASTDVLAEKRKQLDAFDNKYRIATLIDETNNARINQALKEDKTGAKAQAIKDEIKRNLLSGYKGILSPEDVGLAPAAKPAAAPAKVVEPKKQGGGKGATPSIRSQADAILSGGR